MFDAEKVRKDFPILARKVHGKPLIYLDNAATSQKPASVIKAIVDYYDNHNANIHRGLHTLSQEATKMYDDAHENVAKFIGAKKEEVIFVRNASEGLNLVYYGWALDNLKPGDEIVVTGMEHHSNFVPWMELAKAKDVKMRIVDINDDFRLNMKQLESMVNKKTKLVAVSQASNVLGTINPIKEITKIAHDAGALCVVDGAQSVPHMPVDVKKLGCDFLAFSGHKMLAPMGIGGLYGKRELLEKMKPFMFGGDMIKEVHRESATWNDLPWKFEAGTPNVGDAVGFSAAVDYLRKLGMDNVAKHETDLTSYCLKKFSDIGKIRVIGPNDTKDRLGVVSFLISGMHAHDLSALLDNEGIATRSGVHCAQPLLESLNVQATSRASFYVYNTKQEIDTLVEVLKKISKVFA